MCGDELVERWKWNEWYEVLRNEVIMAYCWRVGRILRGGRERDCNMGCYILTYVTFVLTRRRVGRNPSQPCFAVLAVSNLGNLLAFLHEVS
jgi:hypothetical protein